MNLGTRADIERAVRAAIASDIKLATARATRGTACDQQCAVAKVYRAGAIFTDIGFGIQTVADKNLGR